MNTLIFNCGSSSQGFKVYQTASNAESRVLISGKARNVGTRTQEPPYIDWIFDAMPGKKVCDLSDHRLAAREVLNVLAACGITVDAIGHRFVHGGELFTKTTRVDEDTLLRLRKVLPLAPIHNPNSFSVIEVCLAALPKVPQFVVFDTAFHAGLPAAARTYAIPAQLAKQNGFYKYGFHGLSYQYVSAKTAALIGRPLPDLKLILCHLGTGGSSVAAVKDGRSIETSMGYSPLPGLVMSTRCGDLDPEIVLDLVRAGRSADEVSRILNNQSGLVGLSGVTSNLAEIITAAEGGDEPCRLAYDVYVHRLKSYLGAYFWLLDGADAIVFTDDIGVKSWKLRERVCSGVESLGIELDRDANRSAAIDRAVWLHAPTSRTRLLSLPTDEEWVILNEVLKFR